jgi:hypothetical protein
MIEMHIAGARPRGFTFYAGEQVDGLAKAIDLADKTTSTQHHWLETFRLPSGAGFEIGATHQAVLMRWHPVPKYISTPPKIRTFRQDELEALRAAVQDSQSLSQQGNR